MRLRDIIGFVIALLLAIGVAFLTRVFLTREEKPKEQHVVQQPAELTKILVAGRALHEGDKIIAGDIVWQEWPKKALNSNYLKEGAAKVEDLYGDVVRFPLDKGEPVLISALVKPGEKGFLAAIISPGKRAISIDVTAQSASSGLVFPGDYVDVILSKSVTPASGSQYGQSTTIVKNVKVLAIDVETASAQGKPKNVPHTATIEVNPSEAEMVTAAAKEGSLSLSLHSLETAGPKATYEGAAGPKPTTSVILMRGKERSEIQVQEK